MGPFGTRRTSFLLPSLSKREALQLIRAVPATLISGVSNERKHERRFETQWCNRFGSEDAIAFPSARSALTAILMGSGIGAGDEVVATGFTCDAVAEGIAASGASPVWADIDRASLSMRPDELERKLNSRTRAVVIQHMFGIPADIDALMDIARSAGLLVVEDACLAMGAVKDGRYLGSRGDAAIYSYEVSKTISAGWGGMAQINRPDYASAVRDVRDEAGKLGRIKAARRLTQAGLSVPVFSHGPARLTGYPAVVLKRLGLFNDSTTHTAPDLRSESPRSSYFAAQADAHWSVLSQQLDRLDSIVAAYRSAGARYAAVVARYGPFTPERLDLANGPPMRFPLLVKDPKRMTAFFAGFGVELGRWFEYPISPPPSPGAYGYDPGDCPVGEEVGRHMVNLPSHTRMSERDIETTITALDEYFSTHPDEAVFATEWNRA